MDGTTLAEGWNSSLLLIDSQFLPVALDAPGPLPFPEFPAAFAVDLEPAVERILFAVVFEDPAHGVKHPQDRPCGRQHYMVGISLAHGLLCALWCLCPGW